jgi:hypothetical protein
MSCGVPGQDEKKNYLICAPALKSWGHRIQILPGRRRKVQLSINGRYDRRLSWNLFKTEKSGKENSKG